MQNVLNNEISVEENAQVQSEISSILREIELSHERMKQEQDEIERIKAHTKSMIAELQTMRASLR